jgi:hypothetical protein
MLQTHRFQPDLTGLKNNGGSAAERYAHVRPDADGDGDGGIVPANGKTPELRRPGVFHFSDDRANEALPFPAGIHSSTVLPRREESGNFSASAAPA